MGRCLIVANQTLGGEALDRAVRDCIERDVSDFYVVVPMTKVQDELPMWTGGFDVYDGMSAVQFRAVSEAAARDHEAARAEAQRRAQERLDQMIGKVQAAGGRAEGEIGVDDPLEATKVVLAREGDFSEIVVSTLPSALSRWVKMDVPHRIARLTDVPVTTVEDDSEAEPA